MKLKIINILLILSLFCMVMLTGCSNYIWTGQVYAGTIDKSDTVDSEGDYYDEWKVGCAGTWEITLVSKNNVEVNVSIKDPFDVTRLYLMTTKDTLKPSFNLSTTFNCKVWVDHTNTGWSGNGYKADYTIQAVLK
jgi:hypothetical protein